MRLTEIKRDFRLPKDFTDKDIREDLTWQRWSFLMNTFHVLYLQGAITQELFEELTDSLMWFKPIYEDS